MNRTYSCGRINRRNFLADCGMGFTGLALGAMLHKEAVAAADPHAEWAVRARAARLLRSSD